MCLCGAERRAHVETDLLCLPLPLKLTSGSRIHQIFWRCFTPGTAKTQSRTATSEPRPRDVAGPRERVASNERALASPTFDSPGLGSCHQPSSLKTLAGQPAPEVERWTPQSSRGGGGLVPNGQWCVDDRLAFPSLAPTEPGLVTIGIEVSRAYL